MDNLMAIENGVKEKHKTALVKKSQEGNIRAIELRWAQEVLDAHDFRPPVFTDKERGHVSDLIQRMGGETTVKLIVWAARTWRSHLPHPSLAGIPPLPIFQFLYFRRDIFLVIMMDSEKRQETFQKDHQIATQKREEGKLERPKVSLVEMFEQAREKIKRGKLDASAQ